MSRIRRLSSPPLLRRTGQVVALLLVVGGCATLQQIAALRHVGFRLAGARDAALAGVPLDRIASHRDLTIVDALRLTAASASGRMPLTFTLEVGAENPADNATTATMVGLAWTLLLDNRETIRGTLDTAITLPSGVETRIPLRMELDLRDFFEGSAESLLNLASGLVGARADPTRITLRAVPTIETPLGPMQYPSPITIVSRSVGGSP